MVFYQKRTVGLCGMSLNSYHCQIIRFSGTVHVVLFAVVRFQTHLTGLKLILFGIYVSHNISITLIMLSFITISIVVNYTFYTHSFHLLTLNCVYFVNRNCLLISTNEAPKHKRFNNNHRKRNNSDADIRSH